MEITIKLSITLAYFSLFLYLISKEKKTAMYSLIIIGSIGVMVSLILIEYGFYITEQRVFGFQNGSFYIYSLYSYLGLIFFFILSKNNKGSFFNSNSKRKVLFLPVSLIFLAILIFSITQNPSYNRANIFDGPFKMTFVRFENIFFFIFIYSMIRKHKLKEKLIVYFFYCALMFIRGSQFGAFMIAALWLFMSIQLDGRKINFKWYILLFCLAVIPFIIKIYNNDIPYILSRAVLQGHVFWGTINFIQQNGPELDFSGFFNNYNDLFSEFQMGNVNYGFGKLMTLVSPQFGEIYLDGGVRFSAGYPAILIYHFGNLTGLFVHLGFICIYFYIFNYLIKLFKSKDVFYAYFYYLIYNNYTDFMIMGEYAHFRTKFLIKLGLLLLIHFLYVNFPKKIQSKLILQ